MVNKVLDKTLYLFENVLIELRDQFFLIFCSLETVDELGEEEVGVIAVVAGTKWL